MYLGSFGGKTWRSPVPALASDCDIHAILNKIYVLYQINYIIKFENNNNIKKKHIIEFENVDNITTHVKP